MFAETLKKLRRTKKISQVALAEHLGITQQAVGKWETGRSQPDPQTLRSLADYFDVTTDYLLGRAGPVFKTGTLRWCTAKLRWRTATLA